MAKQIFDAKQLPVYLTIEETARLLRKSPETAKKWAQQGKIPAAKIGRAYIVDKDALIKQLEADFCARRGKAIRNAEERQHGARKI